jgi:hypothetical protein
MNRKTFFVIGIIMLIAMAGCGDNDDNTSDNPKPQP